MRDASPYLINDISEMSPDALDKLRARVGFLFQSNALYDSMTVRENLEFPLRRHWKQEQREHGAEEAIIEALTDVGLEHTIDMMPQNFRRNAQTYRVGPHLNSQARNYTL
jgi:phospholipid/cholesterol/gamma-HCH transport system ATP-binding protein